MRHAILQAAIKASKVAITAVRGAKTTVNNARPIPALPRMDGPLLKQPIFAKKVPDKKCELCNFEIEVKTF